MGFVHMAGLSTAGQDVRRMSDMCSRFGGVSNRVVLVGDTVSADPISGTAASQPVDPWAAMARVYYEICGYPDIDGRAIDPRALVIEAATASLRDDVKNATAGRLGVSASGLQGEVDVSLQCLMRSATSLQGVMVIAGAKADAACETWQGLRPLLRTVAKLPDRDVALAAKAGRYVVEHPQLSGLWADGVLSAGQVRTIGDLVRKVPEFMHAQVLEDLTAKAITMTDQQLRYEARRMKYEELPGLEDGASDRADRRTYLSIYPEGDTYGIRGRLTIEQGLWFKTALDALTSVVSSDDYRSFGERQAEALVTMCRQYMASAEIPKLAMARPKFIVLTTAADLIAIANDLAPGDFPVTTFGDRIDPITVRRLMDDAEIVSVLVDDTSEQTLAEVALDAATAERVEATALDFSKRRRRKGTQRGVPPLLLRLLMTPVRPLALGRSVRIVPGWLRDVVSLRDAHCTVDGCEVPAHRCEVHHVRPWADGGSTDIENLALLCVRHHRSVERGKWRLRPRTTDDAPGRYWLATSV
jgi:hypothetical protein